MKIEEIIKGYSAKELYHILSKVKTAKISENFKQIMHNKFPGECTKEDDKFYDKYAGKIVKIYKWSDDWWICEDDNYVIVEEAFDIIE